MALEKLQKLSAEELKHSYPHLKLRELEEHVKQAGRRHEERKADRAAAAALQTRAATLPLRGRSPTPRKRPYEKCHLQEASEETQARGNPSYRQSAEGERRLEEPQAV